MPDSVAGMFENILDGFAMGWASYARGVDRPVVQIADSEGRVLAQGVPAIARPDIDNRIAGFRIALPSEIIKQGGMKLYAFADNMQLPGSPLEIPAIGDAQWHLDGFCAPDTITGWLKQAGGKDEEVCLVIDRNVVCSAKNSWAIDDKVKSGRFKLVIPPVYFDGKVHDVRVFRAKPVTKLGVLLCHLPSPSENEPTLADFPFLANASCELAPEGLARKKMARERLNAQEADLNAIRAVLAEAEKCGDKRSRYQKLCHAAELYAKGGDAENADKNFRDAIHICPELETAHAGLAGVLHDSARESEAIAYIDGLSGEARRMPGILAWSRRLAGLYGHKKTDIVAFLYPGLWSWNISSESCGNNLQDWLQNLPASKPLSAGMINAMFCLASQNGINGFCYFYGFRQEKNTRDFFSLLENGETDSFPFCLCLDNGSMPGCAPDAGIISGLAPLLSRGEYLRHNGKIILMVSRPQILADTRAMTDAWRQECRKLGLGEIFLCAAQNPALANPVEAGFDAVFEFPGLTDLNRIRLASETGPNDGSHATAYETLSREYINRPMAPWPVFHTSFYKNPADFYSSDKRPDSGIMAQIHAQWLWKNIGKSALSGTSIVFINSWNNWTEESDLASGFRECAPALASIRRVSEVAAYAHFNTFWENGRPLPPDSRPIAGEEILVVGKDATLASRRYRLPEIASRLQSLGYAVTIVLEAGGQDIASYDDVAPVKIYEPETGPRKKWLDSLAENFARGGLKYAYCLGVETAWATEVLNSRKIRVTQIVGEFPREKSASYLDSFFWPIRWHACRIVFTSEYSAREFSYRYYPEKDRLMVIREGLEHFPCHAREDKQKTVSRLSLGLPEDAIVLAGSGDGLAMDIFLAVWQQLAIIMPLTDIYGIWTGDAHEDVLDRVREKPENSALAGKLRIADGSGYGSLAAADIFVASGNGVIMPKAVKMAMAYGIPVAAFDMGPDYASVIGKDNLAPWPDYTALARTAGRLLSSGEKLAHAGKHARKTALELFAPNSFFKSLPAAFSTRPEIAGAGKQDGKPFRPRVSAIVPNYNYARYLELRLRTVLDQTYKPHEIIIIDDKSSDTSLKVIERVTAGSSLNIIKIVNESNSGSPFSSWKKGIEMASGDLVWIAEADDYCELNFLESLVDYFSDDSVMLAWADSQKVDSHGLATTVPYRNHYHNKVKGVSYQNNFVINGRILLTKGLLHFNTIPNVSAVLMRRAAIPDMNGITDYISVGDWWLYARMVLKGRAAYHASTLNYHRRHKKSVVATLLSSNVDKAMDETLRLFMEFFQLDSSVFTPEAVLELYRQQEILYTCLPSMNVSTAWCCNNSALAESWSILHNMLDPLSILNLERTKGPALLIIGNRYETEQLQGICRYLAHKHQLRVFLQSDAVDAHPAQGFCREYGLATITDSEMPKDAQTIYFLGLDASLLASDQALENAEKIIVCDKSFDLILKPENHDRKIYSRLGKVLEMADDIFYLGTEMSGALNRLLKGSAKIASRLRYEPLVRLLDLIKNPGPEQEMGVHAFGPCIPALAREALAAMRGK